MSNVSFVTAPRNVIFKHKFLRLCLTYFIHHTFTVKYTQVKLNGLKMRILYWRIM